jgi:hypothetical protein
LTRSIYEEMCKPSPLSKPPKPELKLLTLDEFRELAKLPKHQLTSVQWHQLYSNNWSGLHDEPKPDPRNYRGVNWSEVG